MAAKIETARLGRALRRRQVRGGHDPGAGPRPLPGRRAMQRDAHPLGRRAGGDPGQPHPVQRQTQRIRGRPVLRHHPAFDRPIVAEGQNRGGHPMGAPGGQAHPGRRQRDRPTQCRQAAGADQGQHGGGTADTRRGAKRAPPRLTRPGKIQPDPKPQKNRRPGEQMPALTVQRRIQAGQSLGQNAHACPPSPGPLDRPQDAIPLMVTKR